MAGSLGATPCITSDCGATGLIHAILMRNALPGMRLRSAIFLKA